MHDLHLSAVQLCSLALSWNIMSLLHTITTVAVYDLRLCLQDFDEGNGSLPQDGQQVTFEYTAYNESGARIDSTYQKGRPAQTRLGINGLIPGELLHSQNRTCSCDDIACAQARAFFSVEPRRPGFCFPGKSFLYRDRTANHSPMCCGD